MSSIINIKYQRKILREIVKDLNKLHFSYKKIIGLNIHIVSLKISAEKGKRC